MRPKLTLPFLFRLAYISLIHELLTWSLPTWHLLHHFQHQPPPADDRIRGLDIGTGASAIYPILGIACFPHWNFTATDIDSNSLDYAKNHIIGHPNNGTHLSDRVSLLHVDPNASFLPDQETGLEFTMCNPPFYTSFEEMDRSASLKKLPANAVSALLSSLPPTYRPTSSPLTPLPPSLFDMCRCE